MDPAVNDNKKERTVGQEKGDEKMKFSLLDGFVYIFYFPLFLTGPIITYDEFSKQVSVIYQCDGF